MKSSLKELELEINYHLQDFKTTCKTTCESLHWLYSDSVEVETPEYKQKLKEEDCKWIEKMADEKDHR